MPLTLNVGVSKKLGLPDYGSIDATCNVAVELDSSLLQTDMAGFHQRVRQAYVACAQAVNDELARHQNPGGPEAAASTPNEAAVANTSAANGTARNGHRATIKQLDYAKQLASQIRGLGVRRMESLADKMFGKPCADLSSLDASGLIDTLKDIKAGKIDLDAALDGAAA